VGEREVKGESAGSRKFGTEVEGGRGDERFERAQRSDELVKIMVGEGDARVCGGGKFFTDGAEGGVEIAIVGVGERAVDDEVEVRGAFDDRKVEAVEVAGGDGG